MTREKTIVLVRWGTLSHMRNVATLCNFLSRSDYRVWVITMVGDPSNRAFLDENVRWDSLCAKDKRGWSSALTKFSLARKLKRKLRDTPFDIAYVIDSWTLPIAWIAGVFGRRRNKPIVYHTYDWLEPGKSPIWSIWLERKTCKRADLVINTDRSRARLQQTLYRLTRSPLWIPNLLSKDEAIPLRSDELRSRWFGAQHDEKRILIYPSLASPDRMTLNLIEAFSFLPDYFVLVTFVNDDEYGRQCRATVERNGLGGRVRFEDKVDYQELLGFVASSDIGAIFHNAKSSSGYFMANPDRVGLFAACGIPFVSSDYPNMEALVYRNHLGVCCNAANPNDIADAILELGQNPDSLKNFKKKTRKAFEECLHIEFSGARLVDALKSLTLDD